MTHGRTSIRRGALWAGALLAGLLVVVLAGAAWAAYDHQRDYRGRLLEGTTIAGVDLSGMTASEAVAALRAEIRPRLERRITLSWRGRSWTTTPGELGARSNARRVVRRALEASARVSLLDRVRMRLLDDRFGYEADLAVRYPRKGVAALVDRVASRIEREPVDASLDYSSGWVEITPARVGYRLEERQARRDLMAALRSGGDEVELPVRTLEPERTAEDYDQVLLLRQGENRLYLYQDGEITHSWTVATGQPEYPTPEGLYYVTLKRYMPTWVNPSPDGWGADMPAMIPPGPGNPLGVRALNWNAPAIRFHGTSATYSLGYNASHGCVRLSNSDVIELYDLVEVGTPIVSITVAPPRPLYDSGPDPIPTPEEDAAGDGEADAGDGEAEA